MVVKTLSMANLQCSTVSNCDWLLHTCVDTRIFKPKVN